MGHDYKETKIWKGLLEHDQALLERCRRAQKMQGDMNFLKSQPDNISVNGVKESIIHQSKFSKTLQPYHIHKIPRKDRNTIWTNRENYTLALGIEQYGTDPHKLVSAVGSKD